MEADGVIDKNYFNFQTCSFHLDDSGVKLVMMGQLFLQYCQRMESCNGACWPHNFLMESSIKFSVGQGPMYSHLSVS